MAWTYSDYSLKGSSPQYAYTLVILSGGAVVILRQMGVQLSVWPQFAVLAAIFGFLWPYKAWQWIGWLCLPIILLCFIDIVLVGISAGLTRNVPTLAQVIPASYLGVYLGSKVSVRKFTHKLERSREKRKRLANARAAREPSTTNGLTVTASGVRVVSSAASPRVPAAQDACHAAGSVELNAALMNAAREGDTDKVRRLVGEGADVNTTESSEQWTPLMVAAGRCEIEMVKTLFGEGAVLDAADVKGWTALMIATIEGHKEVVRALLEYGADVNARNNKGWTALRFAVSMDETEILHLLLEAGADLNVTDEEGRTALMQAAGENIIESLKALLDAGADTRIKDCSGQTALRIARKLGHAESIKLLKEAEAEASKRVNDWGNILDDEDSYLYLLKEELEAGLNSHNADDAVQRLLCNLQHHIDALNRERSLTPFEISHKLVLTLKEAAVLSGLPRQHLLESIETRELKAKLIKHGWRIKRTDLDAYIRRIS